MFVMRYLVYMPLQEHGHDSANVFKSYFSISIVLQIFSNALSLLNDNMPEHRKRSLLHNELGKIYYAFNDVQTIVNKYKIS